VDSATFLSMIVFMLFMGGVWLGLQALSNRVSKSEERLDRMGRSKSLASIDLDAGEKAQRFTGMKAAATSLGGALEPQSELERNALRIKLANAGFRSEAAPRIYQGLRMVSFIGCLALGCMYFGYKYGATFKAAQYVIGCGGAGFYLPSLVLMFLIKQRQQAIFLSLPDALDLMVVCVESGLGLDAAMRRVTDEMRGNATVLAEEFQLANLQLQMGRPRREVLHDLGVRTGVDDMRSLAAILIQADRFGASIAQALRVQSDSMRTRRRQIAEEKAAKTAVQLIFPLVLFIFPGIFVVLVGPAAIQISKNLMTKMG
jgi:tight adherence protein C